MKARVKIEQEIEIKTIVIDIAPRYVGQDDGFPADMPLLDGDTWKVAVDVDTGQIHGWPKGEVRNIHCKVCDEGVYTLLSPTGTEIAKRADYVPNDIIPGSYGDYIELQINGEGVITNWPKSPDVSEFFPGDDD